MAGWQLLGFAFLVGLTASGFTASALSAALRVPAGFHPPFVRRDRLLLSLLITVIAGPAMLFNDALASFDERVVGLPMFLFCVAACCGWALATGILLSELAWRAGILVT